METLVQGTQTIPVAIMMIAATVVIVLTLIFLNTRGTKRMERLVNNLEKQTKEQAARSAEIEDNWNDAMADISDLQKGVNSEAQLILEALRDSDMLQVQPLMTDSLYKQYKDFDARSDANMRKLNFANVKFVDVHTEQSRDEQGLWDLVSFLLCVDANMEFRLTHNGIILDNYNTPSTIYMRVVYVRNRTTMRRKAYQLCPVCDTPIYGASCIVCGYSNDTAELPTGKFLITSVSTQNRRNKDV